MGWDKEWVRGKEKAWERKGNRVSERESEIKTGREEKKMKPRDPAETQKNEEKKEWEAEIPPSPPHTHPPCQLCSTESFHHLWFFWGYTPTWDASHQQLWILCRSHKLRHIICKASEFINSWGHTQKKATAFRATRRSQEFTARTPWLPGILPFPPKDQGIEKNG